MLHMKPTINARFSFFAACIAFYALFLLPGVSFGTKAQRPFYISGYAQGTTYHLTYYAKDSLVSQAEIDGLLNQLDSSLSVYKPYSLISRFNLGGSMEIKMDRHLKAVIKKAMEIGRESEGMFDITVYPLVKAWGFGNTKVQHLPDAARIDSLLLAVGPDKLYVKNDMLVKRYPGVQIDVDGIAQGYSVDVLAEFLEGRHISNYLIEIGGEIRVKGRKQPGNQPFQIGVESPSENSMDDPIMERVLSLKSGGLTTSGNYRKYFKMNGRVMSHLIDPKTGYSFQNEMIAVTVLAKDAITADGYDNVFMGMGYKKSLEFLKRKKGIEAYFIYHKNDGSVADTASAGFYKHIEQKK